MTMRRGSPFRPPPLNRGGASVTAVRACAMTLLLLSCTQGTVEVNPVASVTVTPPTASVRASTTLTLVARALSAGGAEVDGGSIVWSSSNKAVASVSSSGVVTALTPGEARIAASSSGKSAVATITVTARAVATVVVTPSTLSMRVGVSVPLQAQTLDVDGAVLTGRTVNWVSSNTAVATVSAQGMVTGITPGAVTITVTSEGRTDQAAVTVTLPPVQTIAVTPAVDSLAVGTERAYTAVLRDAANAVLTGRTVVWTSSNVVVATVSSTGVVSGLSPGVSTIAASSEGRVGAGTVVVLARLASTVVVTPSSSTIIVGATQLLATQVTDAQGNVLIGRPVTFVSDAPTVASVNSVGLVIALAPGTARVTATSEGKVGSANVAVIPIPVASVQVTPPSATMLIGTTLQLTAIAHAADGAVLTGRPVTWTSGAPGIVSVNANGLVTGTATGEAIVIATVGGATSAVPLTVRLPAIASMALMPVDPSIPIAGSVQLIATLLDTNGAPLSGRVVTWSSADESVAFVSSTGLVVGFKSGVARITALSEGVSASTLVTVR